MFSSSENSPNFIEKSKKVKNKKTFKKVLNDNNFLHVPVKLAPYKKPKNKNFYSSEFDDDE